MDQQLTTEQQAEIIANQIIQVTKNRIIERLQPAFDKLAAGHSHFDKRLADAIISDIRNA